MNNEDLKAKINAYNDIFNKNLDAFEKELDSIEAATIVIYNSTKEVVASARRLTNTFVSTVQEAFQKDAAQPDEQGPEHT